jgi:hypothetical protein
MCLRRAVRTWLAQSVRGAAAITSELSTLATTTTVQLPAQHKLLLFNAFEHTLLLQMLGTDSSSNDLHYSIMN